MAAWGYKKKNGRAFSEEPIDIVTDIKVLPSGKRTSL